MKRTMYKWKSLSLFFRIFLFVALAFAVVGFGTLGSVQTTGSAYELQRKTDADEQEPNIIFQLEEPKKVKETDGLYVRLKQIYLNIGTIYSDAPYAKLRVVRASSATSSYFDSTSLASTYYREAKIANPYYVDTEIPVPDTEGMSEADAKKVMDEYNKQVEEHEKELANRIDGDFYNWIAPFDVSAWRTEQDFTYVKFIKLTTTQNILINEVVFVGEGYKNGKFTGEEFVLPAKINGDYKAVFPSAEGGWAAAKKKAEALLDAQKMPSFSQSSFVRFTGEEQELMYMVAEMKMGSTYVKGDVYHADTTYNALGLDILALGTLIFGTSLFGLRFFPMLASFGILLIGYFLVKRLFRSDKAAFIFAILYALCGLSLSLAHIGTAVMIGLFFFIASLDGCHRFYMNGMKKASPSSVFPLLLSGICGALAICVNGAFIIPVAGVAALFVLGMLRQQTAKRYYLEKAIAQAEEEEKAGMPAPVALEEGEEPPLTGRQKVAQVLNEYHYKNVVAPVVFGVSLVIGAIIFSLLFMLPAYGLYLKLYSSPASSASIFFLAGKAFASGFAGSSAVVWSPYCIFFRGMGERYAVTSASANLIAIAAGVFGIVLSIYRIIVLCLKKDFGREFRTELRSILVPLTALVLCLVPAIFAGGTYAFIMGVYLFSFMLAAGAFKALEGMGKKCAALCKVTLIVGLAALITLFALNAIFLFSIPLPASFMTKFF